MIEDVDIDDIDEIDSFGWRVFLLGFVEAFSSHDFRNSSTLCFFVSSLLVFNYILLSKSPLPAFAMDVLRHFLIVLLLLSHPTKKIRSSRGCYYASTSTATTDRRTIKYGIRGS